MKRPLGGKEIPLGERPSAAQMCRDSNGNSSVYQEIRLTWVSVVLTQRRLWVSFPEGLSLNMKIERVTGLDEIWK